MANIVIIDTTDTSPIHGIVVIFGQSKYTFLGNLSYYHTGNILYITGSTSVLKFDLTTDTATVNGTTNLNAPDVVGELNSIFIS